MKCDVDKKEQFRKYAFNKLEVETKRQKTNNERILSHHASKRMTRL